MRDSYLGAGVKFGANAAQIMATGPIACHSASAECKEKGLLHLLKEFTLSKAFPEWS